MSANRNITTRLGELPAFHPTALRLLTISTESSTAIEDYEKCFRADPALASELLQAANSAEYGLRARVESIRHALTLMGLERVSSLSFTLAMRFYMRSSPRRQVIHPIWSHSVASALIAEVLGDVTRTSLKSLYTASLMHELGRLGLLMSEGRNYEQLITQTYEKPEDALEAEQVHLEITHAEAGALMAESWGIPDAVCASIRQHHHPLSAELRIGELGDFVCVSCRMANALGYAEVACRQRETLEQILQSLPAQFRPHPSLTEEALTRRIKQMLGSVW